MAAQCFAQTDDGMLGPMTTAELREAVGRGQVTPETKVRRGDMQKWVRAQNVKGLFADRPPEEEPEQGMSRTLVFTLVGVVCLGLVAAGVVIVSHNRSQARARADAADARLAEMVARAGKWLGGDGSADPEADLVAALADDKVRDKVAGEAALKRVRDRKAEVTAGKLLDEAKQALDKDQFPVAVEKLRAYLADEHATQKAYAQELLGDVEAADSVDAAVAVLTALPEPEYLEFKRTRQPPAGEPLHPAVARRRATTFATAIPTADRKREADRLAAIERQKTADAAAAEAAREAPLDVFLGGTLRGKEAAPWRLPMKFYEVKWTKPKSEFDRPDKFESQFNLDYIPLAPGVQMMLSVKNIDNVYGTEWSWWMAAASPNWGRPKFCSVAFSIDGQIETVLLDKLGDSDSPIHSYFHYTAQVKRAFSPVIRRIAEARTVRYKLTIGEKELEATLPADVHDNIRKLVKAAKYEDRDILIYGK
jgi:hypothetical protein